MTRPSVWALAAGLGLVLSGAPAAQPQEPQPQEPQQEHSFRGGSDLVVLQVSVHDRKAAPVSDLVQKDFKVWEDGVPQTVQFFVSEDRPVSIGLVIDNSTSMFNKRESVIEAAAAFADASNHDDQLFLVSFNEHVSFGLPEGMPFTSDLAVLRDALQTIGAHGQTALYDAVGVALNHVNESRLDQRVLIVVSDGADNRSRTNFDEVLVRALRSNVVIYTVGLLDQEGGNRKVLKRLAD